MEVTKEQIEAWKKEHTYVYRTKFDNDFYYFRTLTRSDYDRITSEQAADPIGYNYEKSVVETCILSEHPADIFDKKSGIVIVLSEAIFIRSGFQQVDIEEL